MGAAKGGESLAQRGLGLGLLQGRLNSCLHGRLLRGALAAGEFGDEVGDGLVFDVEGHGGCPGGIS